MRSDEADEISGLDLPEMGALAYPDFLEAQGSVFVPTGDLVVTGVSSGGAASRVRSEVGA